MATVHDVASYILKKQGQMSAMKLQKLAYYSQAWHLVWEDKPLFRARIEAWALGPVVPELYKHHRKEFGVAEWPHGDAAELNRNERESVNAVLHFYGDKSAQWLSDLSHREPPWVKARKGLSEGDRGSSEITQTSMQKYYGGLLLAKKK